jgi:hypothetical protein
MRAMAIFRILLVVVVVLSGTLSTARAADEPFLGEQGTEDLLKQGIALRRSGNDEAALAVFLDLEKRIPDSVRLLLHIATAAQATGKWIMAYEYMQKAAAHRDEPYYQRHRAAIDNVEKTISLRVGQFRARGTPAGAEVRINGEVIGSLPLTGVRAMEVGSYVLEVYKPGFYPLRRPVTVTGGGGLTQENVDLRERGAALASSGGALDGSGAAVGADTGSTTPPTWWRSRWVTWSLVGVGVAAAATSGVALAIREKDAAHWNDNNRCLSVKPGEGGLSRETICGDVRHDINVAQTVGIVSGVAAIGFGGAALIHWLATSRDRPSDAAPPPQAHASCSPGFGSLVCYGSF